MKSKMLKKLLCLSLSLGLAFSAAACGSATGSNDEIKVGILFSKSGALAITEESMYNAAMLAIDEVNEAGGVNGKKLVPVYEDYGSDPAKAAEKIKKLIMQDKVVATIGGYTSASRLAMTPVVEQNNSVLIYPTFYEGEKPSPNLIYTGCVPNQQGDPFIPWLTENAGSKFFLMGTDTVYVALINSQAKTGLEAAGGTVVGEEYVPNGHSDFSSIITKIKEANPDVIYCNLNGDSAVAFYKQYKQYGLDPEKMPIASFITDESMVQALGAENAAGHYTSVNYFNSIDTPANKAFISKYESKYGKETAVTAVAEASYTSVYLLAQALEIAGDTSADKLIKAFGGLEFDAPQGKISVDTSNQHVWVKSRIGKVNDQGVFEIVYESADLIAPNPAP